MKAIVPAWHARSMTQSLFDEFDQVFQNQKQQSLSLACDVDENEKLILFSFDLPGVEEKDLNIEVKDSILIISGERKKYSLTDSSRTFNGRKFGEFTHHFKLPKSVDKEKVEADYKNGVLKVALPKLEAEQPRKIDLNTKSGPFLQKFFSKSEKPTDQ